MSVNTTELVHQKIQSNKVACIFDYLLTHGKTYDVLRSKSEVLKLHDQVFECLIRHHSMNRSCSILVMLWFYPMLN